MERKSTDMSQAGRQGDAPRVCVLGAGVMGLSTALCISRSLPHAHISVLADNFSPDTTSDVAAGILHPSTIPGTPTDTLRYWFKQTFEHVLGLSRRDDAPSIGVQLVSGYEVFREPPVEHPPFWADLVIGFRAMTDQELSGFPGHTFGWFFTTLQCESSFYLPWLMKKLQSANVELKKTHVENIWHLHGQYDVVVNCTGLGSHALFGDNEVYPVRGQVIMVRAPWLKHFVRAGDGHTYIYPGVRDVTLGGTRQSHWGMLLPIAEDSLGIWERCCALVPSLKRSRRLAERVGLRPSRASIRLERECLACGALRMTVVHCYGHGGVGVTLHWGCAREVAALVCDSLRGHVASAKL
ncbi:D-aspartate oxidase isoform X1 [Petromyzon marinus]|uniref:D-aspartate oxidase isoform X1 n=1 Tax=Petromyzon marinus TaxID=7757 RepID=UPI003F6F9F1C